MDLVEVKEREKLNVKKIIFEILKTKFAKYFINTKKSSVILKEWRKHLFNKLNSMKFLAYIDDDGYPKIIPLFQYQAKNSSQLIFLLTDEIAKITEGKKVAIFCINFSTESVLAKGILSHKNFIFAKFRIIA